VAEQPDIIIGAGLAGLAAARVWPGPAVVLEAEDAPGGACRTDYAAGFAFDRAGHLLHLAKSAGRKYLRFSGIHRWRRVQRQATVHMLGAWVPYPVQSHLHALPIEVRTEVVADLLRARTAGAAMARDFGAWARSAYGEQLTELFFRPYNEKLWARKLEELAPDSLGKYLPLPPLQQMIAGAFASGSDWAGYNPWFWYPRQGGIGRLAEAISRGIKAIHYQARAQRVDLKQRRVWVEGRGWMRFRNLASSMPLPDLIAGLNHAPAAILQAAKQLSAADVSIVHLGFRGRCLAHWQWSYMPESRYEYFRIGLPGNYGHSAPRGCFNVMLEFSGARSKVTEQDLRSWSKELLQLGVIEPGAHLIQVHEQRIPYGYVHYTPERSRAVATLLAYLETQGCYSIGRWGRWEYSAMEDALEMGENLARRIRRMKRPRLG
jgi:protoporphyrinogen oxidase